MKFLPLVWAALRRKTARSIFTLAAITIAFLLFGMMTGISAGFSQFLASVPANRIMMMPRFGGRLPFAYVDQIARIEGVKQIAPSNIIFGFQLGLIWAVVIALLGGLFPAIRAARLPVATALRAT